MRRSKTLFYSKTKKDSMAALSPAPRNRAVEGVDGDAGLHPRIDRIPHDPVREHVLDRTHVELSFQRAMFGDVGQPQFVGRAGGEVSAHQVLMHR